MRASVKMINISSKNVTRRVAKAHATLKMSPTTLIAIEQGKIPKGDVFTVAKIAAIQAAKDTSRLLPLCHPLPLESVEVDLHVHKELNEVEIKTMAQADWKTGVEMEALTAAAAAALCIYDMCKALDRGISIQRIELLEKSGGKSGEWKR